MKNKQYIFGLLLLFLISSCAVKKTKVSNIEVGKAVNRSDRKALISELETKQILYSTYDGKAKAKIEINDKTFNATLNLRIKHQEAIWISVTAFLGIEVSRILITPDRIQIINRLQSEYTDKPFDYIYNFTSKELGFDEIEDLLVGNKMKFIFDPKTNLYHTSLGYEVQGSDTDLSFLMQIGEDFSLLQNKLVQNNSNQTLVSNYGLFHSNMGQLIPKSIQILLQADKLDLNAILDYNNININEEINLPFQVSANYKQNN